MCSPAFAFTKNSEGTLMLTELTAGVLPVRNHAIPSKAVAAKSNKKACFISVISWNDDDYDGLIVFLPRWLTMFDAYQSCCALKEVQLKFCNFSKVRASPP